TLNAGKLAIFSDANLGAGSGNIRLNGGSFELAGNVISNRQIVLGGPGVIQADVNTANTFSGVISGSGSLALTGPGTFTLSGNSSYSGGTSISGATIIQSGTALGTGAVGVSGALVLNPSGNGLAMANALALGGAGANGFAVDGVHYDTSLATLLNIRGS